MSNPIIEVPEEIQATVQRVLGGREFHMATTVNLAEFIRDLNKPEIEVEDFVIYKVQVQGEDEPRMGFRVSRKVPFPWVTLRSNSPVNENAFALTMDNLIHCAEDIKVIERWSPEAPEIKFGITADDAVKGAEVIIKGSLVTAGVDSDGDVFGSVTYNNGESTDIHINAADVALVRDGL